MSNIEQGMSNDEVWNNIHSIYCRYKNMIEFIVRNSLFGIGYSKFKSFLHD